MLTITQSVLKIVAPFQSKEETRHWLKGVFFSEGLLVATDGHRLAAVKPSYSEGTIEDFILPSETVKKILAVKPEYKKQDVYVSFDMITKQVIVFQGKDIELARFPFEPIDGTFPDWKRVIPADDTYTGANNVASFNTGYLAAFESFGKIVTVSFNNDPVAHHLFRAKDTEYEAFGVLMSAKGDEFDDAVVPAWARKPEFKQTEGEAA